MNRLYSIQYFEVGYRLARDLISPNGYYKQELGTSEIDFAFQESLLVGETMTFGYSVTRSRAENINLTKGPDILICSKKSSTKENEVSPLKAEFALVFDNVDKFNDLPSNRSYQAKIVFDNDISFRTVGCLCDAITNLTENKTDTLNKKEQSYLFAINQKAISQLPEISDVFSMLGFLRDDRNTEEELISFHLNSKYKCTQ